MENYCFEFIDKHNRVIAIGGDGDNITAEYENKEIGLFEFYVSDDDIEYKFLLTECNIEKEFQRCGIGKSMIELAEEWYDDFSIVNHLSIEGASFLNFCKKNIFKKKHPIISDSRF